MLSNLEQHFTVESLHHEIPHEDGADSSSSDDESVQNLTHGDDTVPELPWTEEEDELLISNAESMDPKNWILIAEQIPGRTNRECKRRWAQLQRSSDSRSRAPWTKEEDEMLKELVAQHGSKAWKLISSMMNGRKSKQCRERWTNVVDPKLNYAPWTEEEEQILILAQQELGNKWSQIEKRLPGRSANSIKNYWYSALRRGERKRAKMERKALQPEGKKRRPRKPKASSEDELPVPTPFDAIPEGTSLGEVVEEKPKKKNMKRKKNTDEEVVEGVHEAALAVDDHVDGEVANDESAEKPAKKAKKAKEVKSKKANEGSVEVAEIAASADSADVVEEESKKTTKSKKASKAASANAVSLAMSAVPSTETEAASVAVEGSVTAGSVDEDSNGKSTKRKMKQTEEEKLLKPAAKKRRKNIAITDETLSS